MSGSNSYVDLMSPPLHGESHYFSPDFTQIFMTNNLNRTIPHVFCDRTTRPQHSLNSTLPLLSSSLSMVPLSITELQPSAPFKIPNLKTTQTYQTYQTYHNLPYTTNSLPIHRAGYFRDNSLFNRSETSNSTQTRWGSNLS